MVNCFFLQFLDPDGRFMDIFGQCIASQQRYYQLMLSSLLAVPWCRDKLKPAKNRCSKI